MVDLGKFNKELSSNLIPIQDFNARNLVINYIKYQHPLLRL